MTERKDVLQIVLENPNDDLPRLVFADWLEENREPLYAEYIRLECLLAQPNLDVSKSRRTKLERRARSLFRQYIGEWFPYLRDRLLESRYGGNVAEISRGFLTRVEVGGQDSLRELLNQQPLQEFSGFGFHVLIDKGPNGAWHTRYAPIDPNCFSRGFTRRLSRRYAERLSAQQGYVDSPAARKEWPSRAAMVNGIVVWLNATMPGNLSDEELIRRTRLANSSAGE
jgi:uncharacterized protein (TIGR02996 family)